MNKIHKRRLWLILFFAFGISLASGLILYALKQNINAFVTPTELLKTVKKNNQLRLGGVVKVGSIVRENKSLRVRFIVTDFSHEVPVEYLGVLPDLFREGKGVIAEGSFNNNQFSARSVLAKHDENYMPQKIKQSINEGMRT